MKNLVLGAERASVRLRKRAEDASLFSTITVADWKQDRLAMRRRFLLVDGLGLKALRELEALIGTTDVVAPIEVDNAQLDFATMTLLDLAVREGSPQLRRRVQQDPELFAMSILQAVSDLEGLELGYGKGEAGYEVDLEMRALLDWHVPRELRPIDTEGLIDVLSKAGLDPSRSEKARIKSLTSARASKMAWDHIEPLARLSPVYNGKRSADKELEVVERRYGLGGKEPESLRSIGFALGLGNERIRQIENLGLSAIRKSDANIQIVHALVRLGELLRGLDEEGGLPLLAKFLIETAHGRLETWRGLSDDVPNAAE